MNIEGTHYVPSGEGDRWWVVGDTYTFKVTGKETGGSLALVEAHIPPTAGPPPHLHGDSDEFFYVLDGEVEVTIGDQTIAAEPGAFLFVPRGTQHCFRNAGERPARMLFGYTPAGFEEFFTEVGKPAIPGQEAPPLGPEEMARTIELAPRYGMELRLPEDA
jgi:quercetin dioxygenase-like cupin family protein